MLTKKHAHWAYTGDLDVPRLSAPIEDFTPGVPPGYDAAIVGILVPSEDEAVDIRTWYGQQATSYESIINMANSLNGPIKIYVDSTGGAVHTLLSDCAKILAKYKHEYHVSNCMSAAYWLACSGNITARNNLALVGSIGVIVSYEENGTIKHVRNTQSPNKAIGPDSDSEKYCKEMLDPIYNEFLAHVRTYRDLNDMAIDGSQFFAKDGLTLNLIENIGDEKMEKEIEELKARILELESEKSDIAIQAEKALKIAEAKSEELVKAEQERFMTAKELAAGNEKLENKLLAMNNLVENKEHIKEIIKASVKEVAIKEEPKTAQSQPVATGLFMSKYGAK